MIRTLKQIGLVVVLSVGTVAAQQPTAAPQGRGEGRGQGRGGPRGAEPLNLDDRTGFESIFDGTMKNWDGDPTYWRAENGMLVGETSEANKLSANTFVIWRGGEPADFELKLEFSMNSTNSGIQFRSAQVTSGGADQKPVGKWVLRGLPGRHRPRQPLHRDDLRGARPWIPHAAWPGRLHRA